MRIFIRTGKVMKKNIIIFTLFGALITGCSSFRTNTVHTKLQTHEIDEQIIAGKTTQKEVQKKFGSNYVIEVDSNGREMWVYNLAISIPTAVRKSKHKVEFVTDYPQNNKNDFSYLKKYEGFSPEYDSKEYSLILFFNEDRQVISYHLTPKDCNKPPSWQSYDHSFSKQD